MKALTAIALSIILTACTAAPVPNTAPQCPAVPECRIPQPAVRTNADLAQAYLGTRHELQQCKTARDTLAACLKPKGAK